MAGSIGLAGPLFLVRGTPASPGDVVRAPITLVPADREDLACAAAEPVGPYRCKFQFPDVPWESPIDDEHSLVPCMTTQRTPFLIAALFSTPAIRQRTETAARHARFTADCELKLLGRVTDYWLRYKARSPMDPGPAAWAAEAVDCTVR